jgi:hypothetical protein
MAQTSYSLPQGVPVQIWNQIPNGMHSYQNFITCISRVITKSITDIATNAPLHAGCSYNSCIPLSPSYSPIKLLGSTSWSSTFWTTHEVIEVHILLRNNVNHILHNNNFKLFTFYYSRRLSTQNHMFWERGRYWLWSEGYFEQTDN